jgi:hypothetical protein
MVTKQGLHRVNLRQCFRCGKSMPDDIYSCCFSCFAKRGNVKSCKECSYRDGCEAPTKEMWHSGQPLPGEQPVRFRVYCAEWMTGNRITPYR